MPAVNERTQLPALFARYQPVIQSALRENLRGYASELYRTHRYHMGWSDADGGDSVATEGKRLRPTLVMLGADAVGGASKQVLPAAVAIEFVHNFSLIHDDIEDRDQIRHHRPTIWTVWGEPVGIVSGNSMLKVADQAAMKIHRLGVSLKTSIAAQRVIVDAYLRMIEGQFMDISFENRLDVKVDEYLAMIERKTGALIETSLYVGGLIAGDGASNSENADGLKRIGYQLGRLFQIRDDILGVWGNDDTGKPVCGDIFNRKKSLPAVHALGTANGAAGSLLNEIYEKSELDRSDVDSVLEIMDDCRTYDFCNEMSVTHWRASKAIIDKSSFDSDVRDDFIELGEFLVERSA